MIKMSDGFAGQRHAVFPFDIFENALQNPLVSDLVVHSIGYFPKAKEHYIYRSTGCTEYIIIYCVRGEGWYVLDGKKHIVPENHFFILPAGHPHEYSSSEHNPWYIYWAHFKGSKAPYIYERLQGTIPIPPDENSRIDDRLSFFDELLNAMDLKMDDDTINYVSMSFHHLISSMIYLPIYRQVKYGSEKRQNMFFIGFATHYMNENIEKKLTLKDVARYCGYSESYISRLFHQELNDSPINYFIRLKMERACKLLVNTDMKINHISFKLGFNDPYYFSRIFTKTVGMSPRKYRKIHGVNSAEQHVLNPQPKLLP